MVVSIGRDQMLIAVEMFRDGSGPARALFRALSMWLNLRQNQSCLFSSFKQVNGFLTRAQQVSILCILDGQAVL